MNTYKSSPGGLRQPLSKSAPDVARETISTAWITIHYAHCVKFTLGQLDVEPYSHYESREATIEVYEWYNDSIQEKEWVAQKDGKIIAVESDKGTVLALAAYEFMLSSRIQAERAATELEKSLGNPKAI